MTVEFSRNKSVLQLKGQVVSVSGVCAGKADINEIFSGPVSPYGGQEAVGRTLMSDELSLFFEAGGNLSAKYFRIIQR